MKKLITLAVAVLAGALLFTGCYSEIAPEYNKDSVEQYAANQAKAAKKAELKAKTETIAAPLANQTACPVNFTALKAYKTEAENVGLKAYINIEINTSSSDFTSGWGYLQILPYDGSSFDWTNHVDPSSTGITAPGSEKYSYEIGDFITKIQAKNASAVNFGLNFWTAGVTIPTVTVTYKE